MQRVLVTGGGGFIGHRCVEKLSERGITVAVVDNLSNANTSFLGRVKKGVNDSSTRRSGSVILKEHRSVSLYIQDIRNKEALDEIVKKEEIDTCIHLAAKVNVPDSIRNPDETIDVNIKGTFNILEACAKADVKKFVFASSSAVYGESRTLPIHEEQQLDPLSPYGASKIAGEALVSSFVNSGKIQNGASLRLFNVYGKGQSTQYAGVITKFAERLSSRLSPIIYGDGSQVRDFIFLEDVVNAILLAAASEKIGQSSHNRAINLGTGRATRIKDLAQNMTNIFSLDIEPVFADYRKGDIIKSVADISRLITIIGYVPCYDMETTLKEIYLTKK